MTFHTPSQYGDMNTSDKTICPGCGHDQNKHWTNGCIIADCICRKHDINEDAPEYEGLKRNGTSQIGDKTELNLCSICNTMKNIPIGETVCARCKTDDSLDEWAWADKIPGAYVNRKSPSRVPDVEISALDLEALIRAERIKAKREVLTALLNHTAEMYDIDNGGEAFDALPVPVIHDMLAELDTPRKEE
jgi:hypothetical protein